MMNDDRLFPAEPTTRAIARRLFQDVRKLPIISPHGHTDPRWFAENQPFPNPAQLFVTPDHYVFRMLYSQGVALEDLGVPRVDGGPVECDPRRIWRLFAEHYRFFAGTPSAFGSTIGSRTCSASPSICRRRTPIGTTTSSPKRCSAPNSGRARCSKSSTSRSSPLPRAHWTICVGTKPFASRAGRGALSPTTGLNSVIDPAFPGFRDNVAKFGAIAGEHTATWSGYLAAHHKRRDFFKAHGATATDHGHPSAATANLAPADARALFARVIAGTPSEANSQLFRAQMLTEMAAMSLDDGLVMQIHPGSWRNHNPLLYARFGRDKGADIPSQTDYVHALKPLLDRFGNEQRFTLILFTLDESAYSRELAPLAGHYPALRLGPPWWFFNSVNGMRRFRELTTEGFANTVGFNDDTRAFPSIPGRHDVARRVDCAFLAELVATHQLDEDEAHEWARALAYSLAKSAYRF